MECSPLFKVVKKGNRGIIREFILCDFHQDDQYYINFTNVKGKTGVMGFLLLYAIRCEKVDIINLLLDSGLDIDGWYGDGYPCTPLYVAVGHSKFEIAHLLIKRGANVDKQTSHKRVPLGCTVSKGDLKMVQLLLDNGADIECFDSMCRVDAGWTPLWIASDNGHLEIMKCLMDHKADVNALDKRKVSTPLIAAVSSNKLEAVQLLLERGADMYKTDQSKNVPLDLARQYVRLEIIKCLKDHQENLVQLRLFFYSGVWINDSKFINFLPVQFADQANVLAQLFDIIGIISIEEFNISKDSDIFLKNLPIELFHELLLDLWGQYPLNRI